ncbi:MAG: RDD family protein [Sporichthyaceae bacterium]
MDEGRGFDRRALGSWLSGPRSLAEATGEELPPPGKRLGLPQEGPNSVAGLTRRLAATFIDWTIAQFIAAAFMPGSSTGDRSFAILLAFAVINLALVTTVGAGIGGRLLGLRVARLDGANPGIGAVLIRTLGIALVLPPLFNDRDYRGLHDRAARTVVVRR